MRSPALLPFGLIVASAPSLLAQEALDDPLYQDLERIGWDTTGEGVVPGMAVACIREGEIAWTLCCGYADLEEESRGRPGLQFRERVEQTWRESMLAAARGK